MFVEGGRWLDEVENEVGELSRSGLMYLTLLRDWLDSNGKS